MGKKATLKLRLYQVRSQVNLLGHTLQAACRELERLNQDMQDIESLLELKGDMNPVARIDRIPEG